MPSTLDNIRLAAAPHGLNLVAAISLARYDNAPEVGGSYRASAIDPAARSIVVIGNGGGALWDALGAHAAHHTGWWLRQNPLDDFILEVVERDLAAPLRASGTRCTTVYPFVNNRPTLNFIALAKAAGIAGPSILGVAVHPLYGPWIAFRAALLLAEALDSPGDALGFDPCPRCAARTCIPACPAAAISADFGWNIPKCLVHRVEVEGDCAPRCHARAGCILGPEHRYPDDELAYHQARALRSMRPYYDAHLKPRRPPSSA